MSYAPLNANNPDSASIPLHAEYAQSDYPAHTVQYQQPEPGQHVHYGQPAPMSPQYMQQPAMVMAVSTVVPGQPGHIVTAGTFSDGLCDCFNQPGICLLSCFVPCYRWPVTVARVGLLTMTIALLVYSLPTIAYIVISNINNVVYSGYYDPNSDRFGQDPPAFSGFLSFVVTALGVWTLVVATIYRGKLRARYGIHGSAFEDFCIYLWCHCCAVAQEARHVDRDFGLIV